MDCPIGARPHLLDGSLQSSWCALSAATGRAAIQGGHELGSSGVVAETRECLSAADASFRGWQSAGRGVTGYARYLDEIARY